MQPGEVKYVQGSGAKPYELKNTGGVLSCSCPAWRNQSAPIDRRTCKHLKGLLGEAAELVRVGGGLALMAAAVEVNSMPERKLRPDEKAKLNGPPVMLAHSFDEADVDPTGWWVSEKLDGVRAYWDGTRFISRQGNTFHAPAWFTEGLPPFPLDGELWMGRKKFQETISVVKRLDGGERWRQVCFVVFDAPARPGPFEERLAFASAWLPGGSGQRPANWKPAKYMRVLEQVRLESATLLKPLVDGLVATGAEGVMLRKPGSAYEVGRSWSLLKCKPFQDAEGVVVGHEPGNGRHKDRLGALVVRAADGKQFNVGTGLSDAERRDPPKVGATITYRYTELTAGGTPRFPRFITVRDYE